MYPIEFKNVSKSFKAVESGSQDIQILQNLNFQLEENKSTAIIGKSGCGKSTFLHIACGLDDPTEGNILINGEILKNLSDKQKSLLRNEYFGFVFQSNLLLEDFTAVENVMVPYLLLGKTKSFCRERAEYLLSSMNLENRFKHYPKQLSGGEKQRIAICRAMMVEDVKVIIADEPTGSLDEENQYDVEDKLLSLVKTENKTLLMVTHNNDFAKKCDRVLLLKNRNLTDIKL